MIWLIFMQIILSALLMMMGVLQEILGIFQNTSGEKMIFIGLGAFIASFSAILIAVVV